MDRKDYYKELKKKTENLEKENSRLKYELVKVIVEPDTYEAETIRNFYKYMYNREEEK